jgi:hypothetical protein
MQPPEGGEAISILIETMIEGLLFKMQPPEGEW